MSQAFLTRFLAGQRAKGQDQTPLFAVLERVQAQSEGGSLPPQAAPGWLTDALSHFERQVPKPAPALTRKLTEAIAACCPVGRALVC